MKKNFTSVLAALGLVVLLSFMAAPAFAQCAMCKSTVESNRNGDDKLEKFGNGLNRGILYIMTIPYLLAGTVGFFWYKHSRKK
jgi:hypothetical protein